MMNETAMIGKRPEWMDHDALLDCVLRAVPAPFFVVDEDMRLMAFNSAATAMLNQTGDTVFRRRGGEAWHCVHNADSPEGCGRGPSCQDCGIRNSVTTAMRSQKTDRRQTVLETVKGNAIQSANILMTATPFDCGDHRLVLLVLEDITELTVLRRLIPICANCKKIRDDDNYWKSVEKYFGSKLNVDFTHGICPECAKTLYPDLRRHAPVTG